MPSPSVMHVPTGSHGKYAPPVPTDVVQGGMFPTFSAEAGDRYLNVPAHTHQKIIEHKCIYLGLLFSVSEGCCSPYQRAAVVSRIRFAGERSHVSGGG